MFWFWFSIWIIWMVGAVLLDATETRNPDGTERKPPDWDGRGFRG
jgi:hypothetical protein